MTTVVDGVFKTEDLVETTVLSMHGFAFGLERLQGKRVEFVFILADTDDPEFLEELVGELRAAKCRVEPKRFAREMKHVREMLYDFLGVRQGRRLQPH